MTFRLSQLGDPVALGHYSSVEAVLFFGFNITGMAKHTASPLEQRKNQRLAVFFRGALPRPPAISLLRHRRHV
jgi:hypothetical protein